MVVGPKLREYLLAIFQLHNLGVTQFRPVWLEAGKLDLWETRGRRKRMGLWYVRPPYEG